MPVGPWKEHWGWRVSLAILGSLALLLPICIWGLQRLEVDNNVEDWVGKDNLGALTYKWYREFFPSEDSFYLTWEASRLDDPRMSRLIDALLGPDSDGARRGGLPEFDAVRTPHEFIRQIERSARVPRAVAIERLDGLLLGSGPLCVRLTRDARRQQAEIEQTLKSELAKQGLRCEVLPPLPQPPKHLTPADTTFNQEPLDDVWTVWAPHDLCLSWPGIRPHHPRTREILRQLDQGRVPGIDRSVIEQAFFLPGSPVALSIRLSEQGEANRTATFQKVRAIAKSVGIPEEDLILGGRAVTSSALNRAVMNAFWNHDAVWSRPHEKSLVLSCGAISGLLSFWILRSIRLASLVLGLSLYVTFVCLAIVPLLGGIPAWEAATGSNGRMNLVLVVLPPLILVTTLSGSIHLVTYWRHMAVHEPRGALAKAVAAAVNPCFWSSGTTALGLLSLIVSSLQPIRDFGIYGSIGMLVALAAILYGLPALLQIVPVKPPRVEDVESPAWRRFGTALVRWSTPIIAVSLILSAACSLGLFNLRTETKPIRYFADNSRIVQEYDWLEANLAGVAPLQVVVKFDAAAQQEIRFLQRAEVVQQVEHALRDLPDITGAVSLADVLPEIEDPGPDASPASQRMFLVKSKQAQERVARRVGSGSLWKRALVATRFNQAGDELWVITAQSLAMTDTQYADLARDIDETCGRALKHALARHPEGGRAGVSQTLTGVVPLFMATQDDLLNSLMNSFLLASLTIGLAMMIQLRSIAAGLLAMLPNVTPIGIVFGLACWCDVPLDIGTIVTASIAMGLAVDGTLHVINWFDVQLRQGLTRSQAAVEAVVHCGPAMWQTGLIVCGGMFVLWPSELILISRFGIFMSAVVFVASVSDTLFTPALLAGPLGWVLERKRTRSGSHRTATAAPVTAGD